MADTAQGLLVGGQAMIANVVDPDPLARHGRDLLEILFERVPVAIAIYDRGYYLRRFNPTWAEYLARYTAVAPDQIVPDAHLFDLAPGTEAATIPLFEQVLAGETVRQDGLRLESGGIISYWDTVLSPLLEDGRTVGIVELTTDATERIQAYQTLEQRVAERTRELARRQQVDASLRQILARLNSHHPLEETLQYIVAQASVLLGTRSGIIFRLQPDARILTVQVAYGIDPEAVRDLVVPVRYGAVGQAVLTRQPVIVPDTQAAVQAILEAYHPPLDAPRRVALEYMAAHCRAGLAVPLIIKGEVYGGISLYYAEPHTVSAEELHLAATLGDQAALAIENARLRDQDVQLAVAAERHRLARDLHDSVTQTLFSASLIAEVLPRLFAQDPAEGQQQTAELRQLTRGALAEMRTLLLELRPTTLTEIPLGDLLRQLGEASAGRGRIPVQVRVAGTGVQPAEVQIALYRIAQEALNNVVRHARAQQAMVDLLYEPREVALTIRDDGRGFDPGHVAAAHLGLRVMRERAAGIGAALQITSQPGAGTAVTVVWPRPGEQEG